MTSIAAYRNGGYRVEIFPDGTKIREALDPSIPPDFPEQMDLKITDWCDAGCAWCHEGSTRKGRHGNVDRMISLLRDLPPGVEIAIGGGDPLSHPDFRRLVTELTGFGLICNVTVNGRHVERHGAELASLSRDGLVKGIGISLHKDLSWRISGNHVDHMIVGVDDPEVLLSSEERRKVLILGYKTWGRGMRFKGKRPERVERGIETWARFLPLLAMRHHLSFDNLAIEQLDPRRLFISDAAYAERFMGEEGNFSMYVDGVREEYALASYAPARRSWTDIRSMFRDVRSMAGLT